MWLLEQSALNTIQLVERASVQPTAEQLTAFGETSSGDPGSRIMQVAGDTADISIKGVLTDTPDFLAMIFGGGNTTYSDIISAIATAEQDDSIKNIVLSVDSPGGMVAGLFDAVSAIASAKKPVKAVVINQAASAAFALVAQADEIAATNEATGVGSIGTKFSARIDDDIIDITSTKAPKKAPDLRTEEGKAVIREELDALHDIFVSSIAKGRGTTADKVNTDFGEGAMVLADEALKRGMIDSISGSIPQVASSGSTGASASSVGALPVKQNRPNATTGENITEVKTMDSKEFRETHPAVHAQIVAEGVAVGVTQERDRVSAHLTLGEASGDMATATAAVKDGSEMTATLNATYMAAGMKKAELAGRLGDNPVDLDTPAAAADSKSDADTVADTVCTDLGYEEVVA